MKTKILLVMAGLAILRRAEAANALCPGSNGQTYTDSCGAKYAVQCDTDYAGGDLPLGPSGSYVDSLQSCVLLCSKTENCILATWILGSPEGACYLKSSVGNKESDVGIWAGKQISGCAAVVTTSAVVLPTTAKATIAAPAQPIQTQNNAQPAQTITVNNNPVVTTKNNIQQTVTAAGGTVKVVGGTTLSTRIIQDSVPSRLSVIPGSGAVFSTIHVLSTMPGGSVVTLSSVRVGTSSTPSSGAATTLTDIQNVTSADDTSQPKTTMVSNANMSGTNAAKTSGISKSTYIGVGVGVGSLTLLLFALLYWLRWHRKKKKERTPSVDESGEIKHEFEGSDSKAFNNARMLQELANTGVPRPPAEMESPATLGGSPVSPFSTMTGSNGISPTRTGIYELIGSGPAEMPGSPVPTMSSAGASKGKSPLAKEAYAESPVIPQQAQRDIEPKEGDEDRPSSIVPTPTVDRMLAN